MENHTDPAMHLYACGHISRQLNKLMKHLNGGRTAEDTEDVHQVRVACRRLRAALRFFSDCFDDKLLAGWQKQLKKLLKSFGAARDLDVQIEYLAQQLKDLSAEQKKMRPGITRMHLRLRQRRDALQPKLTKSIDSVQKKQVLTNMHLEMQKTLFVLKPLKPSIQSDVVHRLASEQIHRHIDALLDLYPALDDPLDIAGHHAMRIAAKKLRYVMEIGSEAMHHRLKPAIKTVKKIQTLLGEIHDCDVWDQDIDRFIQDERNRTEEFYGHARNFARILPGLNDLKSRRQSRRHELFRQLQDYIEQLDQQLFWQTLLETLHTQPSNPEERTGDERPAD